MIPARVPVVPRLPPLPKRARCGIDDEDREQDQYKFGQQVRHIRYTLAHLLPEGDIIAEMS